MKEVEGKVEGGIEKVKGLEDQVEPIKDDLETVFGYELKRIIGESVKKMEDKVSWLCYSVLRYKHWFLLEISTLRY